MKEAILVPLDGTKMGEAVLPHLEYHILGNVIPLDAEITLLYVLPTVNYNVLTTDERAQLPFTEDDRQRSSGNAYSYLGELAGKLRDKGFQVKTEVKMGDVARQIVKLANEIHANLIAMSTHGRTGIVRWIKGSITDEVLSLENKIPVLTLRVGREYKENSLLSFRSIQTVLKYI